MTRAVAVYPPWIVCRYRLISWRDMEQFSAEQFCRIANILCIFEHELEKQDAAKSMVADEREFVLTHLKEMTDACAKIGLRMVLKHIDHCARRLTQPITYREAREMMVALNRELIFEMEDAFFLHIPSSDTKFYTQEEPIFGQRVHDAFKSARREIEEAGKCLAVGRSTASVFHQMRILECVFRVIAADISLDPASPTWNSYLNAIMPHAKAKYDTDNDFDKRKRAFYYGVEAQLRAIKNKWRDDTMHNIACVYTEEEAKDILNLVGGLMRHLTTELRESTDAAGAA